MALAEECIYTAEDYWNQAEGERAELIDGRLYNMAPPYRIHQELVSLFTQIIGRYISDHNGSCKVYPTPFAVNLTGNDRTWVEPDISVICDRSKLSDRGCEGAPDWIVEIISPSTQGTDYGIKLFKYHNAGVKEYWIVNPVSHTVLVYNFEAIEQSQQYSFDEDIPVGLYPDLVINIGKLLE